MDFRRFLGVLRRFKYIVVAGFVLACVAAFLSYAKIGPNGLSYRQQEVWSSSARLLVNSPASSGQDPSNLAITYSQYVSSDQVVKPAIRMHHILGTLQGSYGYSNQTSTALPTVTVSGLASNPVAASTLATDGVIALKNFVLRQQSAAGVKPSDRTSLAVLNQAIPFTAQIVTPRSKTPPIFVFILVLAATLGLVFVLENLRPRVERTRVEVEVRRLGSVEVPRSPDDLEVPRSDGGVQLPGVGGEAQQASRS